MAESSYFVFFFLVIRLSRLFFENLILHIFLIIIIPFDVPSGTVHVPDFIDGLALGIVNSDVDRRTLSLVKLKILKS